MRHLTNIFRRVYRIFAHAWFQHKGVFWQVEANEGLYIFFKIVCDVYQLIPEDNYTIPPEAEGHEQDDMDTETPVSTKSPDASRMRILSKNENGPCFGSAVVEAQQEAGAGEPTTTVSVGATTRRHQHTPSTGSHFLPIVEGSEEEEGGYQDGSGAQEAEANAGAEKMSPGKPKIKSPHGLGQLDLGAGSLPEIRAPEDPTPLAKKDDVDPMTGSVPGGEETSVVKVTDTSVGVVDTERSSTATETAASKEEGVKTLTGSAVDGSNEEVNLDEAGREENVESDTTAIANEITDDRTAEDEGDKSSPSAVERAAGTEANTRTATETKSDAGNIPATAA